jgi:hypothetical protein
LDPVGREAFRIGKREVLQERVLVHTVVDDLILLRTEAVVNGPVGRLEALSGEEQVRIVRIT